MKPHLDSVEFDTAGHCYLCRTAVQAPRQERSEFASRIRTVLPQTWTLQENGDEVVIGRQDSLAWYPCVSLDVAMTRDQDRFLKFVETNGTMGNYRIQFASNSQARPLGICAPQALERSDRGGQRHHYPSPPGIP